MIIELTSADLAADPRLEDYTRLKDVRLRSKIEPERGLYMAESANVIERALRAGHTPRSFLMSSRWRESLTPLIEGATGAADGAELPVFVADENVLEQMTGFHLHRGALAAMQRPVLPTLDELLATARGGEPARRVVVLENLVDHTNVGAAFRSAAALGVDAVLVTHSARTRSTGDPCASRWAPSSRYRGLAWNPGPAISRRCKRLASPSLPSLCLTIPSPSTTSQRCPPSKGRARA